MSDDGRERLARLALSIVIGVGGAIVLATWLPRWWSWRGLSWSELISQRIDGVNRWLVGAGIVPVTLAANAVLGWLARSWAASRGAAAGPLPRATARYASRPYL